MFVASDEKAVKSSGLFYLISLKRHKIGCDIKLFNQAPIIFQKIRIFTRLVVQQIFVGFVFLRFHLTGSI
jgi:hypothetical protein